MVPKFTSVILTYYYRYIPTLRRNTDRTFLRRVFFGCICLQSNTSYFILALTVRICSESWEGNMESNHGLPFRWLIIGPHWAEREVEPAGKTSAFPKLGLSVLPLFHLLLGLPHAFNFSKDSPSSTCISYAPKLPLSVTLFYLCHVHKEIKGLRVRKTSATLFIHERNSRPHRPHKLRCTTGPLWAKKRGKHDISRVFASLGS